MFGLTSQRAGGKIEFTAGNGSTSSQMGFLEEDTQGVRAFRECCCDVSLGLSVFEQDTYSKEAFVTPEPLTISSMASVLKLRTSPGGSDSQAAVDTWYDVGSM